MQRSTTIFHRNPNINMVVVVIEVVGFRTIYAISAYHH